MTVRQPMKRAVRDCLLPAVTAVPAVQARISGRLSQTSVAYRPGPLVRTDDLRGGPKPGQRCADLQVHTPHGTDRLHHLLGRGEHVLLVAEGAAGSSTAAGLAAFADRVHVVTADRGPAFTLVRPDGVVAVRGRQHEASRVVAYLRDLFADGLADAAGCGHAPADLNEPRSQSVLR
jgi:hypothetical protein